MSVIAKFGDFYTFNSFLIFTKSTLPLIDTFGRIFGILYLKLRFLDAKTIQLIIIKINQDADSTAFITEQGP